MEVIAKRVGNRTVVAYIVIAIMGIVLIVLGVLAPYLGIDEKSKLTFYLIMFIFGSMFFLTGTVAFIWILRYPKNVIVKDGNNLIFKDFTCNIKDIDNVRYWRYEGRVINKWGSLYIVCNGIEHKYVFVQDVKNVSEKLTELINEAKNQD